MIHRLVTIISICVFALSSYAITYQLHTEKDGTQWKPFSKYGYLGAVNGKGKVIIPAEFSYVNYENGTFTVKDNSGYIGKYTKKVRLYFLRLGIPMYLS